MEEAFISLMKDSPWIGFMVYVLHKTLPLFQQWLVSQSKVTIILGRVINVLEEVEDKLGIVPEIEKEEKEESDE